MIVPATVKLPANVPLPLVSNSVLPPYTAKLPEPPFCCGLNIVLPGPPLKYTLLPFS